MTIVSDLFSDLNGCPIRLITTHYELRAHIAWVGGTTGDEASRLANLGIDIALETREGTAYLKTLSGRFLLDEPWDKDIIADLPRNDNCPGLLKDGWWQRELSQITGLTFHHTCSDSPHAFASWYVKKDGGRPSTCYSIWVTQTGEALLCNALTEGNWHDHTGHKCRNLCVGLAGTLHKYHPATVQLQAAARVAAWVIHDDRMNVTPETVRGHMDVGAYAGKTQCPGWDSAASGNWKPKLYEMIEALL
jgi:hypothetical protein